MKKFLCLILILQFFILCACGAKNDNSSNIHDNKNDNESSKNSQSSAISELNAYEKNVFDILVENISSFNNPNSVSIISCEAHYWDGKMIVLRISGGNSFGGVNTSDFIIMVDSLEVTVELLSEVQFDWLHYPAGAVGSILSKGEFYSISEIGDPYSYSYEDREEIPSNYFLLYNVYKYCQSSLGELDLSVSKLNLALKQYKENMGW